MLPHVNRIQIWWRELRRRIANAVTASPLVIVPQVDDDDVILAQAFAEAELERETIIDAAQQCAKPPNVQRMFNGLRAAFFKTEKITGPIIVIPNHTSCSSCATKDFDFVFGAEDFSWTVCLDCVPQEVEDRYNAALTVIKALRSGVT